MPVVHETYDLEKYLWLPLCEFYDFIGRVAEIKFEGTDIADEPLPKRIEYILDGLLTLVDAERNEVRIKQVDLSESDEDYWASVEDNEYIYVLIKMVYKKLSLFIYINLYIKF